MRRAVMYVLSYVGALFVGSFAMRMFQTVAEQLFDDIRGVGSLVYVVASWVVLVLVTAWAFSVFAAPGVKRTRPVKQR